MFFLLVHFRINFGRKSLAIAKPGTIRRSYHIGRNSKARTRLCFILPDTWRPFSPLDNADNDMIIMITIFDRINSASGMVEVPGLSDNFKMSLEFCTGSYEVCPDRVLHIYTNGSGFLP